MTSFWDPAAAGAGLLSRAVVQMAPGRTVLRAKLRLLPALKRVMVSFDYFLSHVKRETSSSIKYIKDH